MNRFLASLSLGLVLVSGAACNGRNDDAAAPTSTLTAASTAPSEATATSTSAATGAAPITYAQDGGSQTSTSQAFAATVNDRSAILVSNGGKFTATGATVTSTGDTSSNDQSSFAGLNAAVLATTGSAISLANSSITTSGSGANGAFAYGSGSSVTLSKVAITATGGGGHGVMATGGGTATVSDLTVNTAGRNSAPLATDRGGGTIIATGGTYNSTGADSPPLYSTGTIVAENIAGTGAASEAAVIEGANSITINNSTLRGANKWGVLIYQSMSGDAEGARGLFTMTGGSLATSVGPLFKVTNTTGIITLSEVKLEATSGTFLDASADSWGNSGSNGGHAEVTATAQTIAGNVLTDAISTVKLTLKNGSKLTGAIDSVNTAKNVTLTLDAASTWEVTADSHLTCLDVASGVSGGAVTNITGNGHTVYYDAANCTALAGKTYTLVGGGTLQPE